MKDSLRPEETELFAPGSDAIALRIGRLTSEALILVAHSEDGWSTLYRDPVDGRYWEHTYPQSELHGGGPPRLAFIPADEAQHRYLDRTS